MTAVAFVTAALVTGAVTPVVRRAALAHGFLDLPAPHKSHQTAVPYGGGVAIMLGVLAGAVAGGRLTAAVVGGFGVGLLGLLDDRRGLTPVVRLAVEAAIAAVVVVGLDLGGPGQAVLAVAWVVLMTNALNLLDNTDGLAAGVAAVAGLAMAAAGHAVVAAAAVAGASLAFLVYNRRPASIFMGDAGSLFLGFVLAVTAVEVVRDAGHWAVGPMLLGVAVVDTAVVTVGRVRRRRPVWIGGHDHLSHRLVRRGLSPGAAAGALVLVQAAVGVVAVLALRDVVPLGVAVLVAAGLLAVPAVPAGRATVCDRSATPP